MKKYASMFIMAVFSILMMPLLAFAQDAEIPITDLLSQMLKAIGDFKALGWQMGLSGLVVLIISSMKNSFMRQYLWDKLGAAKAFVAPILSLIIVVLGLAASGQPITFNALLLALVTGAGALAIHEILDAIKAVPGVGGIWVSIIDFLGKLFKKPAA